MHVFFKSISVEKKKKRPFSKRKATVLFTKVIEKVWIS